MIKTIAEQERIKEIIDELSNLDTFYDLSLYETAKYLDNIKELVLIIYKEVFES